MLLRTLLRVCPFRGGLTSSYTLRPLAIQLQLWRRNSRDKSLQYSVAYSTEAVDQPLPRSRLRRFVGLCTLAIAFTTAGFAMALAPTLPVLKGLLTAPTDMETLTMFAPSDETIANVNEYLLSHPLALELRDNPKFKESRPHLKIPPEVKEHHLTAGSLAGHGKIEVPPLMFVEKEGHSGYFLMYLGTDMCGHPGLVHGGAMATLMDEALARCSFQALPNKVGMTANLTLNYRKPLPAGSFVVVRARTTKVEGRKAWVEGTLESLPMDGTNPIVYTEATALFIEPKQAKVMAQLYPAAA